MSGNQTVCLLCCQRDARNLQDNEHKELRDCVEYLRRKLNRLELGMRMLSWDSGENDPIYAVGIFYLEGRVYPFAETVQAAISNMQKEEKRCEYTVDAYTRTRGISR